MWEISSYGQSLCFLYSMAVGGILGLIYDFFKIDRIVFKRGNIFVFLQDILFWIIATVIFFSFSVVFSNGQIRAYLLFGSFLGFLIYRLTFSKIIILISIPFKKIINIVKKYYSALINKLNILNKKVVISIKNLAKSFLFSKKQKNIKNNLKNS